jgi:dolichol-phosphate mannosyltransferase
VDDGRGIEMSHPRNLYVIVPVFNESENMQTFLKSLHFIKKDFENRYHLKFIMVDDGSVDHTGAVIQELSTGLDLVVLTHQRNQGPGRAFGTGFDYVSKSLADEDWVMTMEGDNTSRYELIHQMFTRTEEGYDVILASPFMYGGGITKTSTWRVILSHIANAFVKELIGLNGIITVSSFFRLYRGAVIKKLQSYYGPKIIERAGFESMIEILLKMIHLQVSISEVPMLLDTTLRTGKSKMNIMRTIWGYLTIMKDKNRWQLRRIL